MKTYPKSEDAYKTIGEVTKELGLINKKTGKILKDQEVIDRIVESVRENGADVWFEKEASHFLGTKYDTNEFEQVTDILDVWFDSGSTHSFVLENRSDLQWPASLYLEGSDQHRGWFHSSLLESVGTRGEAPYKNVLTHGFVLDDKGYKMSKSLGNVFDPLKMMDQYGADIIRLWVMLSDYQEDIRIGKDTLKNTGDLYRRLRNTLRFLLGALDGFTPEERVALDDENVPELERYMLHKLHEMDGFVRECIKTYQFGKLAKRLHDFCNEDLSAFYFDIRKDSITYGQWVGEELSEDNKHQLYIPEGFAHGYYVMSDTAEITYKCSEIYHPEDEQGIRWDDPEIRAAVVDAPEFADRKAAFRQLQDFVKTIHDAGIKVALGNDAGTPNVPFGWGMHHEMELYVEAGLTPMQAIVAATATGAGQMPPVGEADFGTLEVGKVADLVVLNADPLADIRNTLEIDQVMRLGEWVAREGLLPIP